MKNPLHDSWVCGHNWPGADLGGISRTCQMRVSAWLWLGSFPGLGFISPGVTRAAGDRCCTERGGLTLHPERGAPSIQESHSRKQILRSPWEPWLRSLGTRPGADDPRNSSENAVQGGRRWKRAIVEDRFRNLEAALLGRWRCGSGWTVGFPGLDLGEDSGLSIPRHRLHVRWPIRLCPGERF